MSRVAHVTLSKLLLIPAVLAIVLGGASWWHGTHIDQIQTTTNAHQQLTQISYHGRQGFSALKLLELHTIVNTKHYNFGDMVMSIDGVTGDGPKYWTFYINNREASIGAGSYVTKNSDEISWKLQ